MIALSAEEMVQNFLTQYLYLICSVFYLPLILTIVLYKLHALDFDLLITENCLGFKTITEFSLLYFCQIGSECDIISLYAEKQNVYSRFWLKLRIKFIPSFSKMCPNFHNLF